VKKFGSDMKKVDFGRKYDFKVDSNPTPTQYNPNNTLSKTKSHAALIKEKTSNYQRPPE